MTTKPDSKKHGVQLVIERASFYYDGLRSLRLLRLCLLVINSLLLVGILYIMMVPPPPQYFATTAGGRIINVRPLQDPVVSNDYVLQWTADHVRAAFSLDFLHWRKQLQDVSASFTPGGWTGFISSLKKSTNLNTLTKLKMVSNAEIIKAPRIVRQAVVNGHYAWEIQLSILVSYENSQRMIPMPMDVTVVVLRMPVDDYPDKIAINNFLPVPHT